MRARYVLGRVGIIALLGTLAACTDKIELDDCYQQSSVIGLDTLCQFVNADDVSREAMIVAYPADRWTNRPAVSVYVYVEGEVCDIFTGEWHSPPISFEEYMRNPAL